jgi:hypothetical protein
MRAWYRLYSCRWEGVIELSTGRMCQKSHKAGLAIDFSTGCVCVSHASDVARRMRNDNFSSTLV